MSGKKLVILGSSAQVPTRDRNHSGYFMYWNREGLLFDPGEGTQRQLCHFSIRPSSITKIFITHFHGDHCLGLPGIIQRLSLDGISHPVELFFPESGLQFFENLIHASNYQKRIDLIPHPIKSEGEIYQNQSMKIEARRLDHPIDAFGYRILEKEGVTLIPGKLDLFGIKGTDIGRLKSNGSILIDGEKVSLDDVGILKKGQSMAFVMDTRYCDNALKLAEDVDMLICESTYVSDHSELAKKYGHLTSAQAAEIAIKSAAKRLILTHFSQRYADLKQMEAEAREIFPNTWFAADGDSFELPGLKRVLD
jgi:ribonuclease Z